MFKIVILICQYLLINFILCYNYIYIMQKVAIQIRENMSFEKLNLSNEILKSVKKEGYTEPTPVQMQTIPMILALRDVFATAQTGTGKTAAFVLPILQNLGKKSKRKDSKDSPRALILVPTRELAIQVHNFVKTYGSNLSLKSTVIYGGVSENTQKEELEKKPQIVVATTGRLIEHINSGSIKLDEVEVLVLDEADRILDMGFSKEIQEIISRLPKKRQNLMFSATQNEAVKKLANAILVQAVKVKITRENRTSLNVKQSVIPVVSEQKMELLSHLIGIRNQQVMVFARTKLQAEELVKHLKLDGLKTVSIHGDKTQAARLKALNSFKEKTAKVLVATDVASRGIDIELLPLVINFELPDNPQDYVHRIGRTGRAGESGEAISLICKDEFFRLKSVENLIKEKLEQNPMDGYEHEMGKRPTHDNITDEMRNNAKKSQKKPYIKKETRSRTGKKRKTTKRDSR